MSQHHASTPGAAHALAEWASNFARQDFSSEVLLRARAILLDTLGCAIAGRTDPTARKVIQIVKDQGGNSQCSVLGENIRTSAPLATFANGVLVRAIEFNDCYAGPGQIGHPSDNIPAAVATAERFDRSGLELLQAILTGYEVYGRMLDISSPTGPWDHVSVSGIACAIEAGLLMRLSPTKIAEAIAMAGINSATSREVRTGHISAAKSTAGAMIAQMAVQATELAAAGLDGPPQALDGKTGFVTQVLQSTDPARLWKETGRERVLSVSLKPYPCFALAQGPVALAINLRKTFAAESIERLTLSFANCRPVSLRIPEKSNWSPASREAADHSLPYLTAVAWLDGRVDVEQFDDERWLHPDVKALMDRIDLQIDPDLAMVAPGAYTFRLNLSMRDGRQHRETRGVCPGHADNPLSWSEVQDKFNVATGKHLDAASRGKIIDFVGTLETQRSIRPLLEMLNQARAI